MALPHGEFRSCHTIEEAQRNFRCDFPHGEHFSHFFLKYQNISNFFLCFPVLCLLSVLGVTKCWLREA